MTAADALAWYLAGSWLMDPPDVVAWNLARLKQTHPDCAALVRRHLAGAS